ncbi:tenomodulin isoform X2 [Oryzias melastigma]|uniref:tenomodulin isoform X2 n=1 Tax=Oryzias melastigma TaxID=30732 RepID=UPI00168D5F9D|nr:tenomodulin isoform X2 [Oryzias melastigma]
MFLLFHSDSDCPPLQHTPKLRPWNESGTHCRAERWYFPQLRASEKFLLWACIMEAVSQQILWKDMETGKEKKVKCQSYRWAALVLALVLVVLALGLFALMYLWGPGLGKVYEHEYKAVLDGVETDSVMEIEPYQRTEIFKMGNGTQEVIEVHDFQNGITGIRFAEHQRCYIRTQTKKLPTLAEVETEDGEFLVDEAADMKVEDSRVWVPAEEPIVNPEFLLTSKIWEICQHLPIHWIHPSPLTEAEAQDVDTPDAEVTGQRFARDVLDHPAVNDYRDIGIELDNRLDEGGYCCQYCRRGYRFCRRYHEPLGGFNPWPYYYQGGRVICQIVMPCNWWIARMLGRI